MPDDKYNGRYIDQTLVKGDWYGFQCGPKPQTFTGNINNEPESLRNKALIIVSPSTANGTFPEYGHECAVLTTRYGDGFYLQRLFDTQANVEWVRIYMSNSWKAWQRVTTEGDASATAAAADTRSRENSTAISQIDTAIGGRTANPSITSRVTSNASSISSLTTNLNNFKSSTNSSITSLITGGAANDRVARERSSRIINQDVRTGQYPGIKFYANTNQYTLSNSDSIMVISETVANSWGAYRDNSMFFISNANGSANGVHVNGGTFIPHDNNPNATTGSWYAVLDSTTTGVLLLNWMLVVFNQPFQY